MKLNDLRDNDGATQAPRSASAAASAPAPARPAVAASRARRRAPASPSTASRAARCRSTGACRSVASTTSSAKNFTVVVARPASRWRSTPRSSTPRRPSTAESLVAAGVIRRVKDGVRILWRWRDQGEARLRRRRRLQGRDREDRKGRRLGQAAARRQLPSNGNLKRERQGAIRFCSRSRLIAQ